MARKSSVAAKHSEHSSRVASKEKPANDKIAREKAWEVVKAASDRNVDNVTSDASKLKIKIAQTLDTVANETSAQLAVLREVQQAVALAKLDLETVHNIRTTADSLEALLAASEEAALAHETALQDQQDELLAIRKIAEETRRREEADYVYLRDVARRAEEAQWSKKFADIDAALLKRENRAIELELAVENHESEIEAAERDAAAVVTKELEHKHALTLAEQKHQRHVLECKIADLSRQVEELTTANQGLRVDYANAVEKIQSIATKAIEGASKTINVQTGTTEQARGR